jgi:hypothetical protein
VPIIPVVDDDRVLGMITRGNFFAVIPQRLVAAADGQNGVNTPRTSRPPVDMLEPQGGKRYLSSAEVLPGTTGVEHTTDMCRSMDSAPVPAKQPAPRACSAHPTV